MLQRWTRLVLLYLLLFTDLGFAQSETVPFSSPSPSPTPEQTLFPDIPPVYNASKYKQPVYGASKSDQQVSEAPSSISVVTADEIKKYGYRSLVDILQSLNGFYVSSDRNYSYVGIRGFSRPGDYNSRVLLLVDGHRLNDNLYDGAPIGNDSPVDVDLIDRVEVIRGPSSSLYGTNAFFGVINVITKRGRDLQGTELSTEIASDDSYTGRFTYGDKLTNGVEFLFSGTFSDSAGQSRLFYREFNSPATNNGIARNVDGERFYRLFTKVTFSDLSLQGAYSSRRKEIPTGAFGTVFNSPRNWTRDEYGYLDLTFNHEFDNHTKLLMRLSYDRYYYRGNYLYDYTPEVTPRSLVDNQDFALGERWSTEVKLSKQFLRHKLTTGVEYRDNFRQSQWNADRQLSVSYLDDRRSSDIWALYVQDEFSLFDQLILNVGVRYDHYGSFGGTANPRLALIYHLPRTAIKLIYGEAFRAPNFFERLYMANTDYKKNPKLRPESIKTYELVTEHNLNDYWRLSLAGYYYEIDALISQVLDPSDNKLVFKNIESVGAKGIELSLDREWGSGWKARAGYALQKAENQRDDKALTNSPLHMVKLNLLIPLLPDKVFAGLEAHYLSSRQTLAGKTSSDFFLTNFTLFAQNLIPNVEASLSFSNLFDQRYGDPGSGEHRQNVIEQDGRTFWLKVKYIF